VCGSRLALPEHRIVDAKSGEENRGFYNLSLANTLPELQALADQLDLGGWGTAIGRVLGVVDIVRFL
jgi:hypothetical protein